MKGGLQEDPCCNLTPLIIRTLRAFLVNPVNAFRVCYACDLKSQEPRFGITEVLTTTTLVHRNARNAVVIRCVELEISSTCFDKSPPDRACTKVYTTYLSTV